tara:strand:+ start:369 stop:1139 length:771 start_codon:yes stop_codon:yes gene_type:complete
MLLLSKGIINHKISKNIKKGYLAFSLNFAHSNLSGFNVCPKAKKLIEGGDQNPKLSDCSFSCVGQGGNAGIYPAVLESRIKKTIAFFKDRKFFLNSLVYEIEKAIKQAEKKQLKPVFRLNAYSDILFERFKIKDNKNIFELFPETDFYDYSKLLHRKTPANYQITYSHYGNWKETETALKTGLNVAMVFQELPKQLKINNNIYNVIDGDITDLRLNEKINNKPVIVGLKFKGSKAELSHAIQTRFAIPNKERMVIC